MVNFLVFGEFVGSKIQGYSILSSAPMIGRRVAFALAVVILMIPGFSSATSSLPLAMGERLAIHDGDDAIALACKTILFVELSYVIDEFHHRDMRSLGVDGLGSSVATAISKSAKSPMGAERVVLLEDYLVRRFSTLFRLEGAAHTKVRQRFLDRLDPRRTLSSLLDACLEERELAGVLSGRP